MDENTHVAPDPSGQTLRIPDTLALVPTPDLVAFPYMMFPLVVSEKHLLDLVDEALAGEKMIGLFSPRPGAAGDLSPVGTVAIIHKMLRFPDGGMRLLVQAVIRVRLLEIMQEKPFLKGRVQAVPAEKPATRRIEALRRNALELFQKMVDATSTLSDELKVVALNIEDGGRFADFLGANLSLELADKQALLEEEDPEKRLERVTAFMVRELDILALGRRIQDQVQTEMEKGQREFYLRQQMKAIQKELGGDEENPELAELRKRIDEAGMPPAALEAVLKEFERLRVMPPQAAEVTVARTYIDWMVQLPWLAVERPAIDIGKAEKILDDDHFDLDQVKERILEYLAVRKLTERPKSPILCFSGPPGVGKTSLGQSIARALGRPFVRLSLGGLHDEAEIRGHRRTYIGAMPGRIVQGIVSAGAVDPVFMLDEIDKVGADFRGDPTSALLEVLDPAQNNSFHDNYLNLPYDLSRVLFITTANVLYSIPGPLRDRMEVIELPGYTTGDKVEIARRYLVPRALADNGVTGKQLRFDRRALAAIASEYTHEAGVRELERQIASVARKVATRVARGKRVNLLVTRRNLVEMLGKPRVFRERRERRDRIGVATGLAWTPVGGEILFVEATSMPGRGQLTLTGHLGDVMRESAVAALSYVRAHADAIAAGREVAFDKVDTHIHVPSGAMPKDGPSAGVAMVTALASLVSGRAVRADTAMTGEISLRGTVLPIGGLKYKVLGAKRAGIDRIILPAHNEADLGDVPPDIRGSMEFVFVDNLREVLEAALRPAPAARTGRAGRGRKSKAAARGSDPKRREKAAARSAG